MKILLVNGSPKAKGCTYTALCEVKKGIEEMGVQAEIFHVAQTAGCMGCGACSKLGKCVQEDCVNDALKLLDDADGFVFGTPVHYAAAGGSIGGFLDRLFYAGGSKMAFKPGAAVVSCRRGGASAAFDQINKYFTINNMPIASAQYWNMVHGTTPEEVVQDEEGMQNMRTLGRNIAWLVKCIALAKENGLDHPQLEAKIKTNYIR
jgi:multimeric flavodoxin WrbA